MVGEKLSKYPDIYEARTEFKGTAAFIGPKWKKDLKLDSKYLDVTVYMPYVNHEGSTMKGGIYFTSISPDKKEVRGAALINGEKLKEHLLNVAKQGMEKNGCKF